MSIYMKCVYSMPEYGDIGIVSVRWSDTDETPQQWHHYAVPVRGDIILWSHVALWDTVPLWHNTSTNVPEMIRDSISNLWSEYQIEQQQGQGEQEYGRGFDN